jgi:hypothetical protein
MHEQPAEKSKNIYAFPALGSGGDCGLFRLGGTGLGNLLFTWARCLVLARRHGLRRIAPTWPQLCRRPWLCSEPDKRIYHDLFQPADDEITGFARLKLLATAPRLPESVLGTQIPAGSVVVFRGMKGFLAPVLGEHELLRTELLKIVRERHKAALHQGFVPKIAVHVRLGDFHSGNPAEGNRRIGLDWYTTILSNLRTSLGNLPVAVFSDGTDAELAPLLELENVSRAGFGSSIADILALSQARVLVTSGSTFSMWSAFLGQNPTVWFPGRLRTQFLLSQAVSWRP